MPEKLGYKHVETDEEFRERVTPKLNHWQKPYINSFAGEQLDTYILQVLGEQRKIVEVFP